MPKITTYSEVVLTDDTILYAEGNGQSGRTTIGAIKAFLNGDVVLSTTLPTLNGDNIRYDRDTSNTIGVTNKEGDFASDGTYLIAGQGGAKGYVEAATPSDDYIMYMTLKQTGSGGYKHIIITDSTGATGRKIWVTAGFNWVSNTQDDNTISIYVEGVNNTLAATGVDLTLDTRIALQYDSMTKTLNLFVWKIDKWEFQGHTDTGASPVAGTHIEIGGASDAVLYVKELAYAKPNIVAIGDSIVSGSPTYDPNASLYPTATNYANTWMDHAKIYTSNRNNLIVNRGKSSENSEETEVRIAAMLTECDPQIVFFHASTNDDGEISYERRETSINNMLSAINAHGAKVVFLNAIYIQPSGDYSKIWWETRLGNVTGQTVNINIMEPVMDVSTGKIADAYTDDTQHPNVAGHTLIGEFIKSKEA